MVFFAFDKCICFTDLSLGYKTGFGGVRNGFVRRNLTRSSIDKDAGTSNE
jgi:hypothetical protein